MEALAHRVGEARKLGHRGTEEKSASERLDADSVGRRRGEKRPGQQDGEDACVELLARSVAPRQEPAERRTNGEEEEGGERQREGELDGRGLRNPVRPCRKRAGDQDEHERQRDGSGADRDRPDLRREQVPLLQDPRHHGKCGYRKACADEETVGDERNVVAVARREHPPDIRLVEQGRDAEADQERDDGEDEPEDDDLPAVPAHEPLLDLEADEKHEEHERNRRQQVQELEGLKGEELAHQPGAGLRRAGGDRPAEQRRAEQEPGNDLSDHPRLAQLDEHPTNEPGRGDDEGEVDEDVRDHLGLGQAVRDLSGVGQQRQRGEPTPSPRERDTGGS